MTLRRLGDNVEGIHVCILEKIVVVNVELKDGRRISIHIPKA